MPMTNIKELKQKLLAWIEEQKFSNARTDDDFLSRFLEGTKYRIETAKSKVKYYYELRKNSPEWFVNRDPLLLELDALLSLGIFLPLLQKDKNGLDIILVRPTLHNPSTTSINDVFKISFMVLDLLVEIDKSIARNGVHVLVDLTGVSIRHVFQMTPFMVQKTVHAWQYCYPIRFKSMNFINCPSFVGLTLKLMKNFMNHKLRNRIKVHGSSYESLSLDWNCLPEEYGGTNGTLPPLIKSWKEKVQSEREWYIHEGNIQPELTFPTSVKY